MEQRLIEKMQVVISFTGAKQKALQESDKPLSERVTDIVGKNPGLSVNELAGLVGNVGTRRASPWSLAAMISKGSIPGVAWVTKDGIRRVYPRGAQ